MQLHVHGRPAIPVPRRQSPKGQMTRTAAQQVLKREHLHPAGFQAPVLTSHRVPPQALPLTSDKKRSAWQYTDNKEVVHSLDLDSSSKVILGKQCEPTGE